MPEAKEDVPVRFFLDPACPWSWRAALWIREVREVRPVIVEWRLLSLEYINREQKDHPYKDRFRKNRWAMRVLARSRETGGDDVTERLYFALGEAYHERGEEMDDELMLAEAIARSGSPSAWLEETREHSELDRALWASYESVCAAGAFGVPTLFFEGRERPYYGPVIDRVPSGEEAGDLWDHVLGLARHDCFFELKRPR